MIFPEKQKINSLDGPLCGTWYNRPGWFIAFLDKSSRSMTPRIHVRFLQLEPGMFLSFCGDGYVRLQLHYGYITVSSLTTFRRDAKINSLDGPLGGTWYNRPGWFMGQRDDLLRPMAKITMHARSRQPYVYYVKMLYSVESGSSFETVYIAFVVFHIFDRKCRNGWLFRPMTTLDLDSQNCIM